VKSCTDNPESGLDEQGHHDGTPILRLKDVTVRFGGLTALQGVNLEVQGKGIRGIIGPNGAGKTTLFNTITGFVRAEQGTIEYCGRNILGASAHAIARRGITRTFQNRGVFVGMNVLENVMTGYYRLSEIGLLEIAGRLRGARAEEAKVKERASQILSDFKLSRYSTHKAGDLPFGLQRMVEIVRAVISYPRVLLLDEPAAGLNASEREDLVGLLKQLASEHGINIVLTDHSMEFVMSSCAFISVLNYGQILGEGTPEEIQRNEQVIEAYLGRGRGEC